MNSNYKLAVIIALAIVLRLTAAILLGDRVTDLPGTADQVSYHNLAIRLLEGHGFTFGEDWWPATRANEPTAHWSFLYTIYLAGVYAIFGVHPLAARLIQAFVVGLLQTYLIYQVGLRAFNAKVGLAAAAITSIYTYFIYYSATLMTEPFYIAGILAALLLAILIVDKTKTQSQTIAQAQRSNIKLYILLGCILGVVVLLRQIFLLFIPFLLLWVWLNSKQKLSSIIIPGFVLLLMIVPFTIFNYARFQRFVLLNTNAGFAFFWGNHPIYGTHFVPILTPEMGSYYGLIPEELLDLDEAALDQALLRRGIRFIIDDPISYIKLSISRIPAFFMFWPSSESGMVSNLARVTSFGLFWPFMLWGLFASIRRARFQYILASPAFLLILFSVVYTTIHLLTWALIRYRLPVDAVILAFSGVAFVKLTQYLPFQ